MHPCPGREILKRAIAVSAGLGLALVSGLGGAEIGPSAAAARPNIIFILADDLGYADLSCYGATTVKTINLDRLAQEGMRFTDAHAPNAICSPTRYSTLTGRYAFRSRCGGGLVATHSPCIIEPDRLTVPKILKAKGYATGMVGKWHLGNGVPQGQPRAQQMVGFDCYVGHAAGSFTEDSMQQVNWPSALKMGGKMLKEELGVFEAARAVEFIELNQDKPFYLHYTPRNIHLRHTPNKRFVGTSQGGEYGDDVMELDWEVGEVLKTLDRLNLTNNTLIFFSSDNGGTAKVKGLRVEAADLRERVPRARHRRWPGKIKPGSVSHEMICLVDWMATVAAIHGYALPDNAAEDSYSFLPLLLGERLDEPTRPDMILQGSYARQFAIRKGPWKFIAAEEDESKGELYNLEKDRAETTDLAAQHPEILKELADLLAKYKTQGYSRPVRDPSKVPGNAPPRERAPKNKKERSTSAG